MLTQIHQDRQETRYSAQVRTLSRVSRGRGRHSEGPNAFWKSPTNGIFMLFTIGMVFVEKYHWLSGVNRGLGIILVLMGVTVLRKARNALAPEVLLFAAFLVWAFVTGSFRQGDKAYYFHLVRLTGQNVALFLAVILYTFRKRGSDDIFGMFPLVAVILAWYSFASGELGDVRTGETQFATSIVANPNFLGFLGLYGLMGAMFLLGRGASRGLQKWYTLLSIPLALLVILISASRKSFISALVFVLAWGLFAQRRLVKRSMRPAFLMVAVFVAFWMLVTHILPGTYLGAKFRRSMDDPKVDTTRYELHKVGLQLFAESPIVGVGFGSFGQYTGGPYAHSDYMEILATTGLVGFMLHFSIYAVFFRRIRRIEIWESRPEALFRLGLYKAVSLSLLVLGAGAPNFMSPFHWMIVGAMIGHTRVLETGHEPGRASPCRPLWRASPNDSHIAPGHVSRSLSAFRAGGPWQPARGGHCRTRGRTSLHPEGDGLTTTRSP